MKTTVTKTMGGFDVVDFKPLHNKDAKEGREPHVYSGIVKNIDIGTGEPIDITVTWDAQGRCYNWGRADCFIDVSGLE